MKRTILAAVLLAGTALATPASAVDFTLSGAFGTGNYGSASAFFLADGTTVHVDITMDPNFVVDTGSHYALTLSLLGTGRLDPTSFNLVDPDGAGPLLPASVFTAQPHLAVANYANSPFGDFTDAVAGACGNGASSLLCGSTISFNITNFQGFGAATGTFDPDGGGPLPPVNVYAAVDIFNTACAAAGGQNCTGAVGLGVAPVPTLQSVPGPIVGAGLPGLVAALMSLFGLNFWRRRRDYA